MSAGNFFGSIFAKLVFPAIVKPFRCVAGGCIFAKQFFRIRAGVIAQNTVDQALEGPVGAIQSRQRCSNIKDSMGGRF